MTSTIAQSEDCIAILDAGAQYGKVIDRRVRELNVESHLLPLNTPVELLLERRFKAIILSGGPQSVYGADAPQYDPRLFTAVAEANIPILGICYGMQLMTHAMGGKVEKKSTREDGQFDIFIAGASSSPRFEISISRNFKSEIATSSASSSEIISKFTSQELPVDLTQPSLLFSELGASVKVLLTHGDSVTAVAPGFKVAAFSENGIVAAVENPQLKMYGVQFHPEVDLTECGQDIFANFLFKISGLRGCFTMRSREETAIAYLRRAVGFTDSDGNVQLAQGGLSTTAHSSSASTSLLAPSSSSPITPTVAFPATSPTSLLPPSSVTLQYSISSSSTSSDHFDLSTESSTAILTAASPSFASTLSAASKVLVLVSGGVDSTVCAALLKAALPADRIIALHIDNGFMRLNESKQVTQALSAVGVNLKVIDASQTFYEATTEINGATSEPLCRTVQPEVKRKIIGDTFMRVSNQALAEFGLKPEEVYLAQGTLRPDLIESASEMASSNASVIKTHHNDTELVRQLRRAGRIVEPLQDYHKDEVRTLGESLGLPHELVWRQPFPGPGLAVRILCATEPYVPQDAEQIRIQLEGYHNLYPQFQFSLLPVRTVGVQGDGRTYSSVVALSAVAAHDSDDSLSSSNPKTVDLRHVDWKLAAELAKTIPKRIFGVNRVVFVFGPSLPRNFPQTITLTRLTPDCIRQLQLADDIVNRALLKHDLIRKLSQVPVILVPCNLGVENARCICLRPFITRDFMTGLPALPSSHQLPIEAVEEIVSQIHEAVNGVTRVMIDLTPKPPGTTEWE